MKPIPGMPPPDLGQLLRAEDRLSFIYVERCTVHREGNAVTATDERGIVHIPTATLGALLLGPGTRVTHQAMMLLAESGSTAVWVGERGVRYYAHGRSLARSSRLLEAQAQAVTNQSSRLAVARHVRDALSRGGCLKTHDAAAPGSGGCAGPTCVSGCGAGTRDRVAPSRLPR